MIFYLKKAAVKAKVAELERYRKEEELELTIMGLLPVSSSLSFFRRSASSFILRYSSRTLTFSCFPFPSGGCFPIVLVTSGAGKVMSNMQ